MDAICHVITVGHLRSTQGHNGHFKIHNRSGYSTCLNSYLTTNVLKKMHTHTQYTAIHSKYSIIQRLSQHGHFHQVGGLKI